MYTQIREDIILPTEEELAKSLISPIQTPYLIKITVNEKMYEVKVTKMGRESGFPSNGLHVYGFVKDREVMHYTHNSNWIELREQAD
jgi:hypothetical protein